jgi:hypothetical protein
VVPQTVGHATEHATACATRYTTHEIAQHCGSLGCARDDEAELAANGGTVWTGRGGRYYITVEHACIARGNVELQMGSSRHADGTEYACVTLILAVHPRTVIDVCFLKLPKKSGFSEVIVRRVWCSLVVLDGTQPTVASREVTKACVRACSSVAHIESQ